MAPALFGISSGIWRHTGTGSNPSDSACLICAQSGVNITGTAFYFGNVRYGYTKEEVHGLEAELRERGMIDKARSVEKGALVLPLLRVPDRSLGQHRGDVAGQ